MIFVEPRYVMTLFAQDPFNVTFKGIMPLYNYDHEYDFIYNTFTDEPIFHITNGMLTVLMHKNNEKFAMFVYNLETGSHDSLLSVIDITNYSRIVD